MSENERTRLTRSAGTVSLAVMASRLLGLVREMVLAYLFRASVRDAFYAAFRIPNLLRDMFAEGALSKAFVSTFAEVEQKSGREAGFALGNHVLNGVVLVVGALVLLGVVYADTLVSIMFFGAGFDVALPEAERFGLSGKRELTVLLTRIMFPFLLLVSASAVVMGILNSRGRFFIPASASALFNLGSVLAGVAGYVLAPRFSVHPAAGMAVGVLAGGLLQIFWQVPSLLATGFRYRLVLSFRDTGLLKVLRLFGPGALAAATVTGNVFINSLFASMGDGWLAWISPAFRLVHLPIGLIGVAVSMAALPSLSRAVSRSDEESFRETFSYASRLVLLFAVPATVGLIVLAEPIVRLLYQYGRFDAVDTRQVALALSCYAVGLVGYASVKIVTDGFYAIRDLTPPLVVSLLSMASNAGLNWLFVVVLQMDHWGLALATSCTMTLSFACLWFLLRKRSGFERLGGQASARLLGKLLPASLVMGGVAFVTNRTLDGWLGHEVVLARLAQVGASIGCSLLALYGVCRLLRVSELDQTMRALIPTGSAGMDGR